MKTKALSTCRGAIVFYSLLCIICLNPRTTGAATKAESKADPTPGVGAFKLAQLVDTMQKEGTRDKPPQKDRFESEIREFEKQDAATPPAPGGTVFVGSSTIRFWKTLEQDFKEFHAINRGFGGSTFPDIDNYVERIVTKYKPSKVVVYVGTNDIAELHHSGETIFHDYQELVNKVQSKCPNAEIYFISMSMAPSRTEWAAEYDKGNELVRNYSKSTKHLHYINVLPAMRNDKGELRNELFGLDHLHMNHNGYEGWKPIVTNGLKANN